MLTTPQMRLIGELIAHDTITEACRSAGISDRTYRRWKANFEFREALAAARHEAFCEGLAVVKAALPDAGRALTRRLNAQRDADAIRAARAVFDVAIKGVELLDLAERVRALEEKRGSH
jgi:hypothetical protein